MTRVSREINQSMWAARVLRVKVNLPIFKDEKTKDAVAYQSWRWDVTIFCQSGWMTNTCYLTFSSHYKDSQAM